MAKVPNTVFERVLADFKKDLPPEQLEEFAGTTLAQLQLTLAAIQRKQAKTRAMQNLTRLTSFLEAIETYSKVLDVFVNVHEIVAFIWGPIKYLLLVASTFADAFNALLDAYKRISESLPLLEQYDSLFGNDVRIQQALENAFTNIFMFHSEALKYFKGSIWKQVFQATWKNFNSKFQHILEDLEHHKELLARQAAISEFREARSARKLAEERFRAQQEQEQMMRRSHVLNWLSAPDMTVDQERGSHARMEHPESGRWLIYHDTFRAWFDQQQLSMPLLWIHGIPGAGKSVLASLVIEEASKLPSTSVLYFYCRYDDPERNSFVAVARAFVKALIKQDDRLVDHVFQTSVTSGELSLKTQKLAGQLLKTCLNVVGKKYIVIDGLDECDQLEQKHIGVWLRKYTEDSLTQPEPTKCVFFSQFDSSIQSYLAKVTSIRIRPQDNAADIQAYCSTWSKRIQTKFAISHSYSAKIASSTAERAKGMFLFAHLVMHNLLEQTNLRDLDFETRPENFPDGLHMAYARILNRVLVSAPKPQRRDTARILAWLVCALRPLRWSEIQIAMSINGEQQIVDLERSKRVLSAADLCGSLVEEGADGEVQLVHSTAKFYLQEAKHVNVTNENLNMAFLCLEYFCMPGFDEEALQDQRDAYILNGYYGFMDYAAVSWTKHIEIALTRHSEIALKEEVSAVQLRAFEETLEGFFGFHWRSPEKKCKIPQRLIHLVKALRDETLRDRTTATLASMHILLSADVSDPRPLATTSILEILGQIRDRLEALVEEREDLIAALHQYYGSKLYKCPRIHCRSFYDGFESKHIRNKHIQNHQRPFYCPEPTCHVAALGYPTQKALDSHITLYYPPEFPIDADTVRGKQSADLDISKQSGNFECNLCHKRFTRPYNLRSHLKTHNSDDANKVRLQCPVCRKSITRPSDLKRHMVTLHKNEGQYVCQGVLLTGEIGGCGKTFARRDALERHRRSKDGRKCVMSFQKADLSSERQRKLDQPKNKSAAKVSALQNSYPDTPPWSSDQDGFLSVNSNFDTQGQDSGSSTGARSYLSDTCNSNNDELSDVIVPAES